MTRGQLLEAYRTGQRNFQDLDLHGLDLSNCDLRAASFLGANLRGANLSRCGLTHVQLKSANVTHANLSHSSLNATDLIAADFSDSDLSSADFTGAALERSKLVRTNLRLSNLGGADLADSDLTGARLSGAHLYHTVFCNADVSAFCDADRLHHGGPSYIDYRTVIKSYQHARFRQFMTDCGVPTLFSEFMIDCARASNENLLMELMQSTFISYGGPDETFARRLYDALRARGVVTFFFPQTATPGVRVEDEVFRGIAKHDRVLLICSRKSLDRMGVVNEIRETLDREARDGGATYLLPIALDDYVFMGWRAKQPVLAERIGRRVVCDFRGAGRSKTKFEGALGRLVDALKKRRP
jgi:uncharacterized protein YjbI with pentapeptide repeats